MSSHVIRGDARRIPLADESVDLVVTSPPYWALRSYRDNGGHYDGQVGSESHPQLWLEAMWGIMSEVWRVLAPSGSVWINLGDKRAGSGGHNNTGLVTGGTGKSTLRSPGRQERVIAEAKAHNATRRNAPDRYEQAAFGRPKSKMLLPHRFAIGCEDGLADPEGIGWIVRQDQVIGKLNGLPESVTDRTWDSHEMFFHMVKQERYFSATDEIREPQQEPEDQRWARSEGSKYKGTGQTAFIKSPPNPLGKLPGSVWSVASEPLALPEYFVETGIGGAWQEVYKGSLKKPGHSDGDLFEALVALEPVYPGLVKLWRMAEQRCLRGLLDPMTLLHVDHFAAFVGGTELVRRIMLGWSPHAICLTCGEGRRPVVDVEYERRQNNLPGSRIDRNPDNNRNDGTAPYGSSALKHTTILGYSCACGVDPDEPSRPAVVLDPFVGSGTTLLVANALGRTGIGIDMSASYCRLAAWRASQRSEKVVSRYWQDRQGSLL